MLLSGYDASSSSSSDSEEKSIITDVKIKQVSDDKKIAELSKEEIGLAIDTSCSVDMSTRSKGRYIKEYEMVPPLINTRTIPFVINERIQKGTDIKVQKLTRREMLNPCHVENLIRAAMKRDPTFLPIKAIHNEMNSQINDGLVFHKGIFNETKSSLGRRRKGFVENSTNKEDVDTPKGLPIGIFRVVKLLMAIDNALAKDAEIARNKIMIKDAPKEEPQTKTIEAPKTSNQIAASIAAEAAANKLRERQKFNNDLPPKNSKISGVPPASTTMGLFSSGVTSSGMNPVLNGVENMPSSKVNDSTRHNRNRGGDMRIPNELCSTQSTSGRHHHNLERKDIIGSDYGDGGDVRSRGSYHQFDRSSHKRRERSQQHNTDTYNDSYSKRFKR